MPDQINGASPIGVFISQDASNSVARRGSERYNMANNFSNMTEDINSIYNQNNQGQ